jgi:hypothetical protein
MYFKIERQQNVLQVNDSYALLRKIREDGTLDYTLQYSIKQSDAIKLSTKVQITVYTKTVTKKPMLGISDVGRIDSRQLVNNILTDSTSAKTAIKQQDDYVLCRKYSDISAFINNEAIKDFRLDKPIDSIQQLYKTKLKLKPAGESKQSNDLKPILNNVVLNDDNVQLKISSSIGEDTQRLSRDLIIRRGIDPSDTRTITPNTIGSTRSLQGTLESVRRREESFGTLQRLHDNLCLHPNLVISPEKDTNNIDDSKLIDVVVNEPSDILIIPVDINFKLPKRKLDSKESADIFVRFDLLDQKTNVPIDTVTKLLDTNKFTQFYLTPIDPPVVKQVKSEISSRVNLEIKQIDKSSDSVFLYKKNIFTSSVDIDEYVLVGTYKIPPGNSALIQVNKPVYNATIYRCIPARGNLLGYSYTNTVIKPSKYKSIKAISLSSFISENGITIEARKIPSDVVSIQFMQRNLTIFDSTYTAIDSPKLIDDIVRSSDYISSVSRNVLDNHVYEFVAKVFYRDGIDDILGNEVIEYINPTPGKIDIKINNLKVVKGDDLDVSFNVELDVVDRDLEDIRKLLENQGIKSYFDSDITKQREQLRDLLAYTVHRINVDTGEKEDFGVVTTSSFSDRFLRNKRAVKPLVEGKTYRYVITAVARATETTFESYEKSAVDSQTKKNYIYKPSKFLHPIALKKGVLVTTTGLRTKYSKSAFEHGVLGSTSKIEISFDKEPVSLLQTTVSSFDNDHNILAWQVKGNMSSIDHFIIMKEIHGARTILGCAHNQFVYGNCQWIHKLDNKDRGQIRYVIVPMFSDYKRGQEVFSNTISIERN